MLEEGLAADLSALDALGLEIALDHHLRGDPGVVGADYPKRILAEHPLAPGQDVLQRIVERVTDVQRSGDVGRRHDDRPWRLAGPIRAEQALFFPMRVPA